MKKILTEEIKNQICLKFKENKYKTKELAKIFSVASITILRVLKEKNLYVALPKNELMRKYPVNHYYFNKIDTEDKAYFLGLLYADGNNYLARNSITLSLKETDKHILEIFTKFIQPTKPLLFIEHSKKEQKNGFKNVKNHYKISIASKQVSEDLIKWGCVPNKTFLIDFPNLSENMLHHFIRGYFDGDGSITNSNSISCSIIGTEKFLKKLQEILEKRGDIKKTKLFKVNNKDNGIKKVFISGNNNILKFKDWLYKDSSIFLNRKYEIFKKFKPFIKIDRVCKNEKCNKKHYAKNFCRSHYRKIYEIRK